MLIYCDNFTSNMHFLRLEGKILSFFVLVKTRLKLHWMKELSGQNREKFYCIFSNLLIDNLDSLKCAKNVLCKLIYEKNVSSKIQQYYRSLESNNSTFYNFFYLVSNTSTRILSTVPHLLPGGPGAKDSANCPIIMYLVCFGSF